MAAAVTALDVSSAFLSIDLPRARQRRVAAIGIDIGLEQRMLLGLGSFGPAPRGHLTGTRTPRRATFGGHRVEAVAPEGDFAGLDAATARPGTWNWRAGGGDLVRALERLGRWVPCPRPAASGGRWAPWERSKGADGAEAPVGRAGRDRHTPQQPRGRRGATPRVRGVRAAADDLRARRAGELDAGTLDEECQADVCCRRPPGPAA